MDERGRYEISKIGPGTAQRYKYVFIYSCPIQFRSFVVKKIMGENASRSGSCGFSYVVAVWSHAGENCPFFPARTRVLRVGFDDPPKLAEGAKTEEEALGHYRRVRDEIRAFVQQLPDVLA